MDTIRKSALLLVLAGLLAGCVGTPSKPLVALSEPTARVTKPAPDKALVYFIRTSKLGWPFPAPIFDGDRHIGTLVLEWDNEKRNAKKSYVAYEATPGQHLFSVYSENADYLPANLVAGKTYYVLVRVVMGVWKPRFYMTPQQGQLPQHELDEVIAGGRQLVLTPDGIQAVEDSAEDFQKVKAEWWPKYQARPANDRLELRPQDGR